MIYYYNRDGEPITAEQWSWLRSLPDYRIVASVETDESSVVTSWLGIDYGFGMLPVPLIFETLIFADGSDLDVTYWQCHTEAQALVLHSYALAWLAVVN